MAVDVKVPSVGESVKEGMIHAWHVKSGDYVNRDQVLLELETDKATVEVFAESAGAIEVLKKVGEVVAVGAVIARIDTDAAKPAGAPAAATAAAAPPPPPPKAAEAPKTPPASNQPLSPAVRRMVEEH